MYFTTNDNQEKIKFSEKILKENMQEVINTLNRKDIPIGFGYEEAKITYNAERDEYKLEVLRYTGSIPYTVKFRKL